MKQLYSRSRILLAFIFIITVYKSLCQGYRTIGSGACCGANGDEAGYLDIGYSITMDSDNGFVLAGYSAGVDPTGASDAFVVKLAANGNSINWTRGFGSNSASNDDIAYSIIRVSDGFAIAGRAYNSTRSLEAYIVKLTSAGAISWTRTVGDSDYEEALSVIQTSEGGYAVAGWSNNPAGSNLPDIYVVKTTSAGVVSWIRRVGIGSGGTANDDQGYSIVQNADGTYTIAGYTGIVTSAGGYDICIVKLNSDGTLSSIRTIGGAGNDYGYSMVKTSDGGYAIAGETSSAGGFGGADVYVVKLNSDGSTVAWDRRIGGAGTDVGNSIIQTSDGGYAIAGYTTSYGETAGAATDVYVIKLNSDGTLAWTKTIGAGNKEYGNCIVQKSNGDYAISGYRRDVPNSDFLLVEILSSGTIAGCTNSSGGSNNSPGFTSVARAAGTNSTTGTSSTAGTNATGGNILGTTCGASLPVRLLDFYGVSENRVTQIHWTTTSEINNDYFTIERSFDTEQWAIAGTLKGAGNSNTIREYGFTDFPDAAPGNKTIYYRLKQTDLDGNYEYFGPIAISFSEETAWIFTLNNSVESEYLSGYLSVDEEKNIRIDILDLNGKVTRQERFFANKGANFVRTDIRQLNKGIYFFRITDQKNITNCRFVKF